MEELIKYRVCDRCEDETLAVETHKVALNGYKYEIDLCAEHAAELYAAVMDWVDNGTLVGEPTVFDKPRVLPGAPTQLRKKLEPEPEPVQERRPAIADFAHKWIVVPHAEERMGQRKIGLDQVLLAAEYPQQVTSSKKKEGYYEHVRDGIGVVVHDHTIITTFHAENHEERKASGH